MMNKELKEKLPKINFCLLGLIAVFLIVGGLVYNDLPDKVPSHWNLQGEVDGYSSRFFGAFGLPLITCGVYLLMVFVPRIDPKRSNFSKFPKVYNISIVIMVLFFLYLQTLILLNAFNYPINVGKMVRLALGIMFIVFGNYLPQTHRNFSFGIRVPWTLAGSDKLWKKAHRLGGKLFVAAGIIIIGSIFVSDTPAFILTMGSLLGSILITAVYSYLLYRKEN